MIFILMLLAFSGTIQENHEDIIKKAQTLALQRDREKSLQVLHFSIEKENKNKVALKKLIATMDQMGEMLFTEKGQQLFETAESLASADPKQAIEIYREALKIEVGNVLIESRIARLQILIGECDAASSQLESSLIAHPWYEPNIFLLAQSKVCKNVSLQLTASQLAAAEDPIIKTYVTLATHYTSKDYAKLMKESEAAIKKHPDFSEIYWFRYESQKALGQEAATDQEKYKEICNSPSSTLPQVKNLVYSCKNKDAE